VFGLILESLSGTELIFILAIALIFFGPRKLPTLARSMGKGLAEFRKASDDFKRTWEREVAIESAKFDFTNENSMLPEHQPQSVVDTPIESVSAEPLVQPANAELVVARGATADAWSTPEPLAAAEPLSAAEPLTPAPEVSTAPEPISKQNWL
jgi:TatA/E family protein of Tat protein translocase